MSDKLQFVVDLSGHLNLRFDKLKFLGPESFMNRSTIPDNGCEREDIAAYLDGELAGEELTSFETHLKSCVTCATDLRTQRQLLCTLDVAFSESRGFELPRDFTRVVAAHAESNLSGMR